MKALDPYLNFPGNTEEAFNFYKSVFGGEFVTLMRMKDTPGCENLPADDLDKIMHIALPVGGNILMATDLVGPMADSMVAGTNISLTISPDSREEADQLYAALSAGGQATVPMHQEFFGYFGMLTDKFGIQWMLSFDENLTP